MRTPELGSLGRRLKRSWLFGWLHAPHSVRPLCPGNTGGFGDNGVLLDLATREGIVRGIQRDGQFRGLPDRLEDGTPRLVASLLARHAELNGSYSPTLLGMPMGLPPIPDEEIDLINTWIEQGAPE